MVQHITSVTDAPHSVAAQTVSECVRAFTITRQRWGWGCEVSDVTGGVIPPTSASNLQQKKDTLATSYLPPAILSCPSSCSVLHSHLNPNQTLDHVTNSFNRNFQSNIQKSGYLFISAAVVWASTSQEFMFSAGLFFLPFCQTMIKR